MKHPNLKQAQCSPVTPRIRRRRNQKVLQGFEVLKTIAKEDKQEALIEMPTGLFFICECIDGECHERVWLTIDKWWKIHSHDRQYCVANGHVDTDSQVIVARRKKYIVVRERACVSRQKRA